ncbi:MAG TPA: hypothetical protein VKU02_04085, partial [Gemmataceae bacterium]|nr:hypothetical protein [Gemmataceae bacterium]
PDSVSTVAPASGDGAAFLATTSNSVQSGKSSQSDDAYWRLTDQRPGDLNDWASSQLALALNENALRTSL